MRGIRLASLGLFLALAALTAYFGPQTVYYFKVRQLTMPPWWCRTPDELPNTKSSAAAGTVLSYFGYSFEAPWVGVEKESIEGRWASVKFIGGEVIVFTNPETSQEDPFVEYSRHEPDEFRGAFGANPPGSKFDHLEAILGMTPSKLSPFLSRGEFHRRRAYLEMKGTYLEHSGATDLYYVRTSVFKGFEINGIDYNGRANIILFDSADREFNITVSAGANPQFKPDQTQINRLIQTFGRGERGSEKGTQP
jgi:hypothetical protein